MIVSALLLRLAFPRWNLYPFAALALAPFLWVVAHATSGKQAFFLGWVFGAVFYYVLLIWLNVLIVYSYLIPPAVIGLALYVGLFKAVFAWVAWQARRWTWVGFGAVAAAWVGLEYLQSVGDLGFPWGYLGHSLWRHPPLIQLAAWTGVYGLSLVLFWIAHLLSDGLRSLRREPDAPPIAQLLVRIAVLGFFAGAMFFAARHAAHRIQAPDFYVTPPYGVGIVQPNIPQREKFRSYDGDVAENQRRELQGAILTKTIRLTSELQSAAPDQRLDLIIWPESAVTDLYFARNPAYATLFDDLATSHFKAPLFFGADNLRLYHNGRFVPAGEGDEQDYARHPEAYSLELYNGAWLAEPGRGLNPRVYNKTFLVPFAEGIPFVQRVEPLVRLLAHLVGMEPFKRGTDHAVFELHQPGSSGPPLGFGPLICYESCYPVLSRILVRHGAEMLVIITNDAWYETTAGPAQHELEAIFRAVETHRWVARCANTGISCFVSPWGAIEHETTLAQDAAIRGKVRGVKELTFYSRWGDLFAWFTWAILVIFLIARKRLKQPV